MAVIQKDFSRKQMKDFSYMKYEWSMSWKQMLLYILIQLVTLALTTYFLNKRDY
jgi:hypothetical protein